jgi:Ca2+-binding RTX toxin-like protein
MRHGSHIAAFTLALALSAAPTAHAKPPAACEYFAAERALTVTVNPGSGDSAREGEAFVVQNGGSIFVLGGPEANQVHCAGGAPTVTNTNTILIGKGEGVRRAQVAIDMRRGLLTPGASDERDGHSEIEVFADLGASGRVVVAGTSAPDSIDVGRLGDSNVVNFNAAETRPDADVFAGPSTVVVAGGAGGDMINGAAPAGFGPIPPNPEEDGVAALLTGGGGGDVIAGSEGSDILQGDGGRDLLDAGGGRDLVFARDRKRDRVVCGRGRELSVIVDPRDRLDSCERTAFDETSPELSRVTPRVTRPPAALRLPSLSRLPTPPQ